MTVVCVSSHHPKYPGIARDIVIDNQRTTTNGLALRTQCSQLAFRILRKVYGEARGTQKRLRWKCKVGPIYLGPPCTVALS
jgi:hypothetical protein